MTPGFASLSSRRNPVFTGLALFIALILYLWNPEHDRASGEHQPLSGERPPKATNATCKRVIDGDTLIVVVGGREEKLRLIGIDAMEGHNEAKQERQAEYHGVSKKEVNRLAYEASRALRRSVEGKKIQVIRDPRSGNRDRYDRLLRYVEVDGKDVGASLLQAGLAEPRREPHERKAHYTDIARPLAFASRNR